MKIAVLGGQFNPPHVGHLIMAQQVLDFTSTQEVWLTPCYQHTFDKKMALVKHRVTMTKMLSSSKEELKYCDEEIKNRLGGASIDLMDFLFKKYPQHQFSFIIGSDNLPYFKKWGRWEKLITKYPFYIVPRAGFDVNLKKYSLSNMKYKFKLLKDPLLTITNISSTMVRKRIKQGLSITNLVPQSINQYIKKHGLYK